MSIQQGKKVVWHCSSQTSRGSMNRAIRTAMQQTAQRGPKVMDNSSWLGARCDFARPSTPCSQDR